MGTEQFSPVIPDNGGAGGNIKQLHSLYGSLAPSGDRVGSAGENVRQAGLFSTAPHGPKQKYPSPKRCAGLGGECRNVKKLRSNGLCPGCDAARIRRERYT